GTGDLHETLTLPPGSSVTYTVTTTITAGGVTHRRFGVDPFLLVNTATAAVAAGTIDTDPSNNTGTGNAGVVPRFVPSVDQNTVNLYGIGTGSGGSGTVEVRSGDGMLVYSVNPLGADGSAGVRVAIA